MVVARIPSPYVKSPTSFRLSEAPSLWRATNEASAMVGPFYHTSNPEASTIGSWLRIWALLMRQSYDTNQSTHLGALNAQEVVAREPLESRRHPCDQCHCAISYPNVKRG